MAYKTIQCVSILNLKLFGPMKTELWAKEFGHFSVMLYMGKLAGSHSFAYQYGCCNINVWKVSNL